MNREEFFKEIITEKSNLRNVKCYVKENKDNLIEGVTLNLFQKDLEEASGHEFESKFRAIHSSSALAVNSFAIIKNKSAFEFLGYKNFDKIKFEHKFKTGLCGTPPHLDFVLENRKVIIGFESKFLEPLHKTKVIFRNSYNPTNLKYLDDFWFRLIKGYKQATLFLDVAQLIRHSIGMINNSNGKKIILVYIYWTPTNKDDYSEYKIHQDELDIFAKQMKNQKDIEFVSMTYEDLWNIYDKNPDFAIHNTNLRKRYKIEIK